MASGREMYNTANDLFKLQKDDRMYNNLKISDQLFVMTPSVAIKEISLIIRIMRRDFTIKSPVAFRTPFALGGRISMFISAN